MNTDERRWKDGGIGKRKGDEVADEEQGGRKKYECKSEKKYFKMRLF
jgi:hypothetical protein